MDFREACFKYPALDSAEIDNVLIMIKFVAGKSDILIYLNTLINKCWDYLQSYPEFWAR